MLSQPNQGVSNIQMQPDWSENDPRGPDIGGDAGHAKQSLSERVRKISMQSDLGLKACGGLTLAGLLAMEREALRRMAPKPLWRAAVASRELRRTACRRCWCSMWGIAPTSSPSSGSSRPSAGSALHTIGPSHTDGHMLRKKISCKEWSSPASPPSLPKPANLCCSTPC